MHEQVAHLNIDCLHDFLSQLPHAIRRLYRLGEVHNPIEYVCIKSYVGACYPVFE